jgi:ATP-dependent DNA helicase PIF1
MNTPINALEITDEFDQAISIMQHSSDPLFVTGKAGTGKSTLLTYFRSQSSKKIVVLAPTGVAALHVKGETIHSFFRFKSNVTTADAVRMGQKTTKTRLLEQLDAIVIDEISMVRADLIDCMDLYLREALKVNKPFGGKQMIWIGDLYQLPPVVTQYEQSYFRDVYDTPYFFSAHAVQHAQFDLQFIELTKIYRQKNQDFIDILNAIRVRTITPLQLAKLNEQTLPPNSIGEAGTIYLSSTNATAHTINVENLKKLIGDPYLHPAQHSRNFDIKMAPTDFQLTLKVGAQVMFVNNDHLGLWVNGTLGKVTAIHDFEEEVEVLTQDGMTVTVAPHQWQTYKHIYDAESKTLQKESAGTFTQFPLKLAWAITIHKSQGKTFSKVIVDLGNRAFAKGQVYVALSRCESLEGLSLKRPVRLSDILIDPKITHFLNNFTKPEPLKRLSYLDKQRLIETAIDSESEITITYISQDKLLSERRVFPRKLGPLSLADPGNLALQCFCFTRQSIRVFRLDRILDIR